MVSERYRRNAGAIFSLKYHMVWCTKYRRPVLVGPVAERLSEVLREKAVEHGATIMALEIMPDHVHLFVESDPTKAPSHLAAQFKGASSHVLRAEFSNVRSRIPCLWSRSYYIGAVGNVSADTVKHYIDSQSVDRDFNSALEIQRLGLSLSGVTWAARPCVPGEAVCFS